MTTPSATTPATAGKPLATLQARAALIGFSLGPLLPAGGPHLYALTRWDTSRTLPSLAAVADLLRGLGAPE